MSTVTFHIPFNEDTVPDWDGTPTITSTSSKIVVEGGPFHEEFLGLFSVIGNLVSGTLSAVRFSINQTLAFTVEGMNVNANNINLALEKDFELDSLFSEMWGGDDTINGSSGIDFLPGFTGNDTLYGGAGIDTAMYLGMRGNYTVSGSTVSGSDGSDTLNSIERLTFLDGTLAFDVEKGSHAGDMYRLYQAAFNREPDAAGVGFWIGQYDKGSSIESIAAGFMDSNEFRAAYGTNPGNQELVTLIYQNVLHRAPDAGGLKWYVDLLNSNKISNSQENYDGMIAKIKGGFLFEPYEP